MTVAPRPSIVSGQIVRDLKALMATTTLDTYNTRNPVSLERTGYAGREESWTVSYSARADGRGGYYESGGIKVTVRIQRSECGSIYDTSRDARLPAGHSETRFYNLITRLWHWTQEEQRRNHGREALYNFLEKDSTGLRLTPEDHAAAEATGREMCYQSMTDEDLEFWWAWVRERHPESFLHEKAD